MCRILCVRSEQPFAISEQLKPFAAISENSREYQGHGWGFAARSTTASAAATDEPQKSPWTLYHNIKPVWEDNLGNFGETTLLIAHARSAFRDEGIAVENNMPFSDGTNVFVFNGELRGVRIKESGRIGAEKIFNYIKRFNDSTPLAMLDKGTRIINKRTRYVRAMNIIMSNGRDIVISSHFGEDPDYFQLRRTRRDHRDIICSTPWPDDRQNEWQRIDNGAVLAL